MFLSLAVCIAYLCKICRVPPNIEKTPDQKQLVWVSISVVFFNDPTYLVSIYKPSLFTSVISQLWLAIFFALLLQYWLRSVEMIKDRSNE
jgi:hypothetical protein